MTLAAAAAVATGLTVAGLGPRAVLGGLDRHLAAGKVTNFNLRLDLSLDEREDGLIQRCEEGKAKKVRVAVRRLVGWVRTVALGMVGSRAYATYSG